jgi:hypothetical protein
MIPGYVNLNLGYRQRTLNHYFNFKPGDEFTLLAEGGWQATSYLMGKASIRYLYSTHPQALGITFRTHAKGTFDRRSGYFTDGRTFIYD